jgi:putative FmdB family regulatory protein
MEKLQKISDPVLVDCPSCEQASLRRLVSAAAFRLKGAGWYETDFKKDNKRNLAEGGGKNDTEAPTKTSDSKPDADCKACKADAKPAAATTSNP